MPPYSWDWSESSGEESLHAALARSLNEIAIGSIGPGDILLFRMTARAPAKHCGIFASRDGAPTLIHARQNKRVSEEVFSSFWRKKLAHAFRL